MRLKGGAFLSNLKNALFPVEGWEMPKFFSMSFMMFMIIYIYTTVRDTKDTLVVSSLGSYGFLFWCKERFPESLALAVICHIV